ncbi:M28 family metallopeptidase [Undibacterium fentianense]|uniref:M28 family peptidase n=1 Tax=Undibacterium fentianense TaxID=2828728 RepID=A0A941E2H1_9BURK|nr:M28 family peptidase [Undibacterium fentianense]MBR7799454.1 M28 family peptidase [Undibacterium fentianense]
MTVLNRCKINTIGLLSSSLCALGFACQTSAQSLEILQGSALKQDDFVVSLVRQLDLEKYKATIKSLTEFGDRRQGTERNRRALDWIEAQLQAYGCTNTQRMQFDYTQPPPAAPGAAPTPRRNLIPSGGLGGAPGQGGSTLFGKRAKTGVNTDPLLQPNEKLRQLNAEQTPVGTSQRENVYCTKIGKKNPDEMYIVGAHFDGIGFGEAANDNGSGTALVMELARIFSAPDVETDKSIRFVLWNNEETGLNGAYAYVAQRKDLQGIESPKGSGLYPEPKWLGMIQHDMMLWDHGMPVPQLDTKGQQVLDAEGKPIYVSPKEQRAEADVNIEFQSTSKQAEGAAKLAWFFRAANDKYATDYPAAVGFHMTNTDSVPFMDLVPAISLRENERGMHIGAGWNPNWHQPSDVFTTYSDKDFRLGLNAAQTTLSAVAVLSGAKKTTQNK